MRLLLQYRAWTATSCSGDARRPFLRRAFGPFTRSPPPPPKPERLRGALRPRKSAVVWDAAYRFYRFGLPWRGRAILKGEGGGAPKNAQQDSRPPTAPCQSTTAVRLTPTPVGGDLTGREPTAFGGHRRRSQPMLTEEKWAKDCRWLANYRQRLLMSYCRPSGSDIAVSTAGKMTSKKMPASRPRGCSGPGQQHSTYHVASHHGPH